MSENGEIYTAGKNLHCRQHWRHGQIPPLLTVQNVCKGQQQFNYMYLPGARPIFQMSLKNPWTVISRRITQELRVPVGRGAQMIDTFFQKPRNAEGHSLQLEWFWKNEHEPTISDVTCWFKLKRWWAISLSFCNAPRSSPWLNLHLPPVPWAVGKSKENRLWK